MRYLRSVICSMDAVWRKRWSRASLVVAPAGDVYILVQFYTLEGAMRTNIDIDDEVLDRLMKITGAKTKKQAVNDALREALHRKQTIEATLALRGTVEWEGDLDAMRRDKPIDSR